MPIIDKYTDRKLILHFLLEEKLIQIQFRRVKVFVRITVKNLATILTLKF